MNVCNIINRTLCLIFVNTFGKSAIVVCGHSVLWYWPTLYSGIYISMSLRDLAFVVLVRLD